MNNWKLTLAYDGTNFHGWQIQPGLATVQGTLSDTVATVFGERVLPQGAGRTDAGVHAADQVASFSLAAPVSEQNLRRALNRVLPPAIRVLAAEIVPQAFHARHSAIGKIYVYRIFEGEICSPFLAPFVAPSRWPLNFDAMQQAAQIVVGEHDFTSFAAVDPDRALRTQRGQDPFRLLDEQRTPSESSVRRIDISRWSRTSVQSDSFNALEFPTVSHAASSNCVPLGSSGMLYTYSTCGNGFLHHMVRNLVGTFLEVGRGRIGPLEVAAILRTRNRTLAGPTAPAKGLCLLRVLYPADYR